MHYVGSNPTSRTWYNWTMITRRWKNDKSWFKRHSLSIALVTLLIVQAIVVLVTGYPQFASDAQTHGDTVQIGAFLIWFTYEMFVSVIADTYGALLLVLFAKWFYEEGSPESEGSNNE